MVTERMNLGDALHCSHPCRAAMAITRQPIPMKEDFFAVSMKRNQTRLS
jgi:hypothetical protein